MSVNVVSALAGVDALLAEPWTDDGGAGLRDRFSGGEFTESVRVAPLASSGDFFEDEDGSLADAAYAEFEPAAQALVDGLAARFGTGSEVDVLGQATFVDGEFRGDPPITELCNVGVANATVWSPPDSSSRLFVGLGHLDKELPLQLIAAVCRDAS